MGKGYPSFVEEYKKVYGEAPISGYHANAYDAAEMAIKAIPKVAKTDKEGNLYIGRKALRDAVFAEKFEGMSGPIACDAYGQCAKFKPAVYEFISAIQRHSRWARTRRKSGHNPPNGLSLRAERSNPHRVMDCFGFTPSQTTAVARPPGIPRRCR